MQGIYRLLFPNNKCYIGLSNNLKRRLSEYKNLRCKKQPKVYEALKLFGWSNVKVEVIILFDSREDLTEQLNSLEIKYIKKYNSLYPKGYNLTPGGDKRLFLEETKLKMRRKKFINWWDLDYHDLIFNYKIVDSDGNTYENAIECYVENKDLSVEYFYDLFKEQSKYHYIEKVKCPFGDSIKNIDVDYYSDMLNVNQIYNIYLQRSHLDKESKLISDTLLSIIHHKYSNNAVTSKAQYENLLKELIALVNNCSNKFHIEENFITQIESVVEDQIKASTTLEKIINDLDAQIIYLKQNF